MARTDLELLRELLGDSKTHLTLAVVDKVEASSTVARCQVKTLPEELELVAKVTWDACSQGGGVFVLPAVGDLVLVAYTTDDREPYVIRRLSSSDDPIPKQAQAGHLVAMAPDNKKAYLASAVAVLIGAGGLVDPSEPLPLGNVLLDCLNDLYTRYDTLLSKLIAGPIGMGNLGSPVPTYPQLITDLTAEKTAATAAKAQYLDTPETNILSQTAFTER